MQKRCNAIVQVMITRLIWTIANTLEFCLFCIKPSINGCLWDLFTGAIAVIYSFIFYCWPGARVNFLILWWDIAWPRNYHASLLVPSVGYFAAITSCGKKLTLVTNLAHVWPFLVLISGLCDDLTPELIYIRKRKLMFGCVIGYWV